MNSRTFVFTTLVVVLFVVGCGGGEDETPTSEAIATGAVVWQTVNASAQETLDAEVTETPTKRLTELLNGTWRGKGYPPDIRPYVFDFDKGTWENPWLSGTGGTNTLDLTLIEETEEMVTFEARGYTWKCRFNEDGTVTLDAVGTASVQLERVE
jgi:hypothetical protein